MIRSLFFPAFSPCLIRLKKQAVKKQENDISFNDFLYKLLHHFSPGSCAGRTGTDPLPALFDHHDGNAVGDRRDRGVLSLDLLGNLHCFGK